MRLVGPLFILSMLLLAGVPLSVHAQADSGEVEIFTEDAGDLEVSSNGQPAGNGNGRFVTSDLTGLYLQESAEAITFRLQVADIDPDQEVIIVEQGTIVTEFILGDAAESSDDDPAQQPPEDDDPFEDDDRMELTNRFALELFHSDGGDASASLSRWDAASERYVDIWRVCDFCEDSVTTDPATESYLVPIPRDLLLDRNGAAINPALPLHDFLVQSYGTFNNFGFNFNGEDQNHGFLSVYDRMPDDGEPDGEFVPVLGVKQSGHIHLSSPAPVRASNGEATTYVYDVTLENNGEGVDDVRIVVVGAPDNWQIKLPAESLHVENDTSLHLPVLVTTPFGHKHGAFESFTLEAHSARDPTAVGRVELGVRYTTIPQMAGHHSRLWLHSSQETVNQLQESVNTAVGQGASYAYFNAAEGTDDPRDLNIDVSPRRSGGMNCCSGENMVQVTYDWRIFLEPTLEIGLDFDINGTGIMEVPIVTSGPMEDVVIEGTMYYLGAGQPQNSFFIEDDALVLGSFAATEPTSFGTGQTKTLATTFTPTPEADFIPYDPAGATVWIDLDFSGLAATTGIFTPEELQPKISPGGYMDLPLNEYHDPVDDLYVSLADVEVIMESDQEQYVNSGETILFEVRIENTGVVNDDFQVILGGTNTEWARLLGDTEFSIRSGESRRIVVAVTAPFGATNGENADLVLEAISRSDDNARALVRLYGEVDNLVDHEDKSHLVPITSQELTRNTPVGAWIAPMALLGAVAFLRRKTRL